MADDPSCRWYPGDWCCTSPVIDQAGDNVLITKNTKYTLQDPCERVELPVKALIELRQGVAPDEYLVLKDLERQGCKVKIEPGDA